MNRPEQALQQQVVAFLRAAVPPPPMGPVWFAPDPGVLAGGQHAARIGAIRKSMGVRAGVPDIVFLSANRTFGIELKAKAGKPSAEQITMHADLAIAGVRVFVARTLPEVQSALIEMGVPITARVAA
jgi:hypothetical protein